MRFRPFVLTMTVILAAAACGGWVWIERRRFERELADAVAEMNGGRERAARQRLTELSRRRPDSDAALYQLGLVEEKLARPNEALATWSRIGPRSEFHGRAAVGRARLLMNRGRFSDAEDLLVPLRHGVTDADPFAVRQGLELMYRIEGRTREVRELLIESWTGAADPTLVLKRIYLLDDFAFPVDFVRKSLASGDAEDDRVWLGQAHLAIWLGKYEEAAEWLDRCASRRPADDQPIWEARLELAMGTRDGPAAMIAMRHLEAGRWSPIEVLRLRAWFASSLGSDQTERDALLALTGAEPGNGPAWARLAELDVRSGDAAEAKSFREKQEWASKAFARYAKLIAMEERARHVSELRELATQLGRQVEARGWTLIAEGRAAAEPLRVREVSAADADATRSLAALLNDLAPLVSKKGTPPAVGSTGTPPAFVDQAASAGLTFFHDNGHTARNPPPPETMCGGVALFDYDGDGWLDLYAVQGGPFPPSSAARNDGDRLYRNRGDGTFEDASERSGIASFPRGYGHGVTIGDYDNDGHPDIFVTRWRSYSLYHNRGDGRFDDVTKSAGLAGERDWPTSAAFADLDADGDLDLYVCHYLLYDPSKPKRCDHPESPSNHECMPRDFPSLPDHVFRNDGGQFVDVTAEAGFVDPDGRGLGVVAADFDDDGRIDLYVANDMSANYLFRNLGGFKFEEIGQISGSAVSADGTYKSGMGIACGDLDGDGKIDLAVTNFFGESTTFYKNLGSGNFADQTAAIGLLAPSRPLLGFGLAFVDMNNDGWLDLLSTNGHVLDSRPRIPLLMPLQLLVGSAPAGKLTDVSERAGEPFQSVHLGRGLAVGDVDNDGRLDAIVLNQNEPLVYLHNETERPVHFIRFALEGLRSNRDAVGARVTIEASGRKRIADRIGGSSYQSANDPRIHFGLGAAAKVDGMEVRWPSGHVDRHGPLAADRDYRLREGAAPLAIERSVKKSSKPAKHD